jgi:thermitase
MALFAFLVLSHTYCSKAHAATPPLDVKPANILDREIIIAVIDTGIDIHHHALKTNLWKNIGEIGIDANGHDKATNNIDDDNNGYIDDTNGWNFAGNNNDVSDSIGHGTHISGIIAGKSSPRAPATDFSRIKIMTLKYFDKNITDTESIYNTVNAVKYAIRMGATVINYSSSGAIKSKQEENIIKEAAAKGILFITAAGNSGMNLDKYDYYPANYKSPNIISVSSIDSNLQRLPSSNFGKHAIPAPGKSIYSTLPNGQYGPMTGTSQATAFVSGKVADLLLTTKFSTNYFTDEIKASVRQEFTKVSPRLTVN